MRMRAVLPGTAVGFLCAWAAAQAPADKPQRLQLYPRNAQNTCAVAYAATAPAGADSLILEVSANGAPRARLAQAPAGGKAAFTATLEAGLVEYAFALGARKGAAVTPLERVDSVVCGDAYIIAGQSNANASRGGQLTGSEWVRGFGPNNNPKGFDITRFYRSWGLAEGANDYSKDTAGIGHVGYWGYKLGDSIAKAHKVPVAFILAAAGGTAISWHMKGYVEKDTARVAWDTVNMFNQLRKKAVSSGLAGHIKAVIWHQGEWDQWDGHPSAYARKFDSLYQQWREFMPGLRKAYLWQIPPSACDRGTDWGSPLREAQRAIAVAYPYASVLSNLATAPEEYNFGDNCHWRSGGYGQMARELYPLVAREFYGAPPGGPLTAPNLRSAGYANAAKTEVKLEFDQDVAWEDSLVPGRPYPDSVRKRIGQQYLRDWITFNDDTTARVLSGSAAGRIVTLKLNAAAKAKQVSYVHKAYYLKKYQAPGAADSSRMRFGGPFLWGRNGQPALTFFKQPLEDQFQPSAAREGLRSESRSAAGSRLSRQGGRMLLRVPVPAPGRAADGARDLRGRRVGAESPGAGGKAGKTEGDRGADASLESGAGRKP